MKAPSELLVLHGCTEPGFAALNSRGRLHVVPLDGLGSRKRPLVDAVQDVLRAGEAELADVGGLVVTLGPGSFTGIRVAIATAQGLALARSWMIWTADSLLFAAAPWVGGGAPVAVCHDARRGEVYAALYDGDASGIRTLVPPMCASPLQARERLRTGARNGVLHWTGSGADLVRRGAGDGPLQQASPTQLAAAIQRLATAGQLEPGDAFTLEPFYLRRPDVRPPHTATE